MCLAHSSSNSYTNSYGNKLQQPSQNSRSCAATTHQPHACLLCVQHIDGIDGIPCMSYLYGQHAQLLTVLALLNPQTFTGGCCSCCAATSGLSLAPKNDPILAWRCVQFLRTTASVAVSTRSLNGLGLSGEAGKLKGFAGEGAMALRSQPAKGIRGGGQSGTSAPGPYLTARQDLSTSGFTSLLRLTLTAATASKEAGNGSAGDFGVLRVGYESHTGFRATCRMCGGKV